VAGGVAAEFCPPPVAAAAVPELEERLDVLCGLDCAPAAPALVEVAGGAALVVCDAAVGSVSAGCPAAGKAARNWAASGACT
jgi:hypothetical protein